MRSLAIVAAMIVLTLTGYDATRAGDLSDVGARASKSTEPRAPRITCSISMHYWCIVQADATVNMIDSDGYRTWSIKAAGSRAVDVVVRENKLCDSSADYGPRRISESDDATTPERRSHVVTLALTADGVCTVRVEYPIGEDDWARAAQRIAQYQLLVCSEHLCRVPLLSIK